MLTYIVFVALLATGSATTTEKAPVTPSFLDVILTQNAESLVKSYVSYLKTGYESPLLKERLPSLVQMLQRSDFTNASAERKYIACVTCRATVNVATRMFRDENGELNGVDSEELSKKVVMDTCQRFEINTPEVCSALFDFNWPFAEYIIKNSTIDSQTFCALFLEYGFCDVKNAEYNWTLPIDKTGAPITGPKVSELSKAPNDLRILQLTDIHYDPLYVSGALAECDEPQCCQRHKDLAEGTTRAAGFWGDYRNCDTPWHTLENALNHIKETHAQIDYIYETGDIIDHMVWGTGQLRNKELLSKVHNKLAEVFPNITIYPCIGNHESHPVNLFSPENVPENVSSNWLYEHLYNDWSKWLPESTRTTILKGGYYTVSPKTGFRIISLNNNECYSRNWWLFYDGTDKIPQLQWLHDTLLAAESAGEFVHILAHIPSGDNTCWSVWAREYNKIIERFSNTISAIFNGHSHKDEMQVHYSSNGHAIGVSWNGGSLTTYSFKNPNYRIYRVEPSSMQVVDHETWIFNLTEANRNGAAISPNWFKEYEFGIEFINNPSPAEIDKLLDTFAENPDELRKFWRFKMTSADPKLAEGCDSDCLLQTICRLATTVNNENKRCLELQAKLSNSLNENSTTETTTEEITTTTAAPDDEDDDDDGAAAIVAFKLSVILCIVVMTKFLF